MKCESCDRENVIKAYCYFSHRLDLFQFVYGKVFSPTNFAQYAIELGLKWRTAIQCQNLTKVEIRSIWIDIQPFLIEALQESKVLKG